MAEMSEQGESKPGEPPAVAKEQEETSSAPQHVTSQPTAPPQATAAHDPAPSSQNPPITASTSAAPDPALAQQNVPIEADNDDEQGDGDSAFDADSTFSDTSSLRSEITKYRFENNRRYHSYKDGEYWGPNDEQQNNQLDIAHHLYLLTLGGKLFLAPIGDHPQNVLDVGTGTGIWAIDFADQYPSAQVIGFDLSPIQPKWIPPNVRFEVNDACESDWGYRKNNFDFIHVRAMYGSVADWPAFYQQALEHLVPGGWFQQIEMSVVPMSDDGTISEDSIFAEWGRVSLEAGDKFGKDLRIHEQIKGYLQDAGFEDVVETVYKWPIGPWSKDPHMKQLGMWNRLHWEEGIEGWSLALLTRVLGWTYTGVQAYLGRMRAGLKDRKVHAYHIINVVYGRKPGSKST